MQKQVSKVIVVVMVVFGLVHEHRVRLLDDVRHLHGVRHRLLHGVGHLDGHVNRVVLLHGYVNGDLDRVGHRLLYVYGYVLLDRDGVRSRHVVRHRVVDGHLHVDRVGHVHVLLDRVGRGNRHLDLPVDGYLGNVSLVVVESAVTELGEVVSESEVEQSPLALGVFGLSFFGRVLLDRSCFLGCRLLRSGPGQGHEDAEDYCRLWKNQIAIETQAAKRERKNRKFKGSLFRCARESQSDFFLLPRREGGGHSRSKSITTRWRTEIMLIVSRKHPSELNYYHTLCLFCKRGNGPGELWRM